MYLEKIEEEEEKKLIKSHPNFVSANPSITNAKELYEKIKFVRQNTLERTSTDWELRYDYENNEKLQNIYIDVEKIDRLYFFSYNRDNTGSQLKLVFRMLHKEEEKDNYDICLYVKLTAFTSSRGGESCCGTIYISKYRDFFVDNVVIKPEVKNLILGESPNSSYSFAKTHPNFKSFDSKVKNAIDIYAKIGEALLYQNEFTRTTTTKERKILNIQKIKIIVEKIDRIYLISFIQDKKNGDYFFILVARMDYHHQPIYVELYANFNNYSFGGNITFSMDYLSIINESSLLSDDDKKFYKKLCF